VIAGNSLNLHEKDPNYGDHMGIAPEAHLINVKVADEDGRATVLDVIHGLQFVVDHKDAYNIRVVNLSLASTVAESYRTDPLDAAAEQAWLQGVVVVAAAGNEGDAEDAVSYAPGNDPYVISVGAVDDRGTRDNDDDRLAAWSSRGLTQDGFRKPEVLAPGTHIVAPVPPMSDLTAMCPTCLRDGRYFRMGGTSMSAAVVSGVAALVLQRHPDWTPNQVKGALVSTLVNVPGVGGEVNAYRALYATSLSSNVGLVPNELIDPATGEIDHLRASFRRASFRSVDGDTLDASWSRASFRCDCSLLENGTVDPARASFRRASFRKLIGFAK
jgi:serine protease AprX